MSESAAHQAEDARRRFVTDLANELRTPLNAIICLVDAAQIDCPAGVPCRPDLEQIRACAWQLSASVDRLLDLLADAQQAPSVRTV